LQGARPRLHLSGRPAPAAASPPRSGTRRTAARRRPRPRSPPPAPLAAVVGLILTASPIAICLALSTHAPPRSFACSALASAGAAAAVRLLPAHGVHLAARPASHPSPRLRSAVEAALPWRRWVALRDTAASAEVRPRVRHARVGRAATAAAQARAPERERRAQRRQRLVRAALLHAQAGEHLAHVPW